MFDPFHLKIVAVTSVVTSADKNPSAGIWNGLNHWLNKDEDPFHFRSALLYTGIGFIFDLFSQAISIHYGFLPEWDPARTVTMLTFPGLDAHLMGPCWKTLDRWFPEHVALYHTPQPGEISFLTTHPYYQNKMVRSFLRGFSEYIFLAVPLRSSLRIAMTVSYQYAFQTGGIQNWEDFSVIPGRIFHSLLLGLFWPLFNMFNLREVVPHAMRRRNVVFMVSFWTLVSTAVAGATALPPALYGLPYLVCGALAAKSLRENPKGE